jgi:hypothetical protein
MKYYSEEQIRDQFEPSECEAFFKRQSFGSINVRLCRDCPYFEQEHPTIDTDGDLGFCTYKTDFAVLDDEPIHWYFTNKNSFCDENTLGDEDAY